MLFLTNTRDTLNNYIRKRDSELDFAKNNEEDRRNLLNYDKETMARLERLRLSKLKAKQAKGKRSSSMFFDHPQSQLQDFRQNEDSKKLLQSRENSNENIAESDEITYDINESY